MLADVDAIGRAIAKLPDCKLIVVDPIRSYLGSRTDSHRDNEIRAVLAPIAALAEKHGVVVAPRRKSGGTTADDLALGSRAYTGIARAVSHFTRDTDDKVPQFITAGKEFSAVGRDGDFETGGEARSHWRNRR